METFIYDDYEVRKTGRIAIHETKKEMQLVEVTPVNEADGTWTKFVNPKILFKVQHK